MTTRIAITCNDVPPGCGVPGGAQGLRAFGLWEGFRCHEVAADIVVSDKVVRARLERWGDDVLSIPPYLRILPEAEYLTGLNEDYDYVLCPNWTSVDGFKKAGGVKLIYDFFSPTLIEQRFLFDPSTVDGMRRRKLEILRQADLFIANGEGRAEYGRGLLHEAELLPSAGVIKVGLALPWNGSRQARSGVLRVFLGGYDQAWVDGLPLSAIQTLAEESGAEFTVIGIGSHLHFKRPEDPAPLAELGSRIRVRDVCPYEEYAALNADCDLMLDIFQKNEERTLSYSTRSISSLCCGCPVIHPDFTEIGAMVAASGAGWVLAEPSLPTLIALLARLSRESPEVAQARTRTRALWEGFCDPAREIEPLLAKL